MAWIYIAVVALFELWLLRRVRQAGSGPVSPGEPPYHFSDEQAALVQRYRFYFTYPALARGCSSILAAIGLTALGLAPWLTYKRVLLPAALIGLNLFAVARFTKLLAPLTALRSLEVHDRAWAKIRAGNQPGRKIGG